MEIETLVIDLSKDPFNPALNFEVALEYERLNQTASAVSFFLRAAEYGEGNIEHKETVYISLIKIAKCLEDQMDRGKSVSNALLQAIAFDDSRPEAYFLLSQHYERKQEWQECYTFAVIGCGWSNREPLSVYVGYEGYYCLLFEKAVSAWWIGRREESIALFNELKDMDLNETYRNAVESNLRRIQP